MTAPEAHGKGTIATALHELRATLPPSESRVARTLLEGYPLAGIGTLAELAEKARVSSPTVLRLINRLGFSSFGDFERALLAEVEARLATTAGDMPSEPPQRDGHLVQKLLLEAAASLSADAQALVGNEVDEVVELIATRARTVATMGGWLTEVFARYLFLELQTMRPRCRLLTPAPAPVASELVDLGRRDALVVFDTRPYAIGSEQICSWARRRGVRIVLFTDEWLSPISRQASHVLVGRSASSSPFDSFTPLFALTEAVVAAVAARLGDDARKRVSRAETLLNAWEWRPVEPGDK